MLPQERACGAVASAGFRARRLDGALLCEAPTLRGLILVRPDIGWFAMPEAALSRLPITPPVLPLCPSANGPLTNARIAKLIVAVATNE